MLKRGGTEMFSKKECAGIVRISEREISFLDGIMIQYKREAREMIVQIQ